MTPEEQERMTRVGKGTPMGRLLRHYWMPVAASSQVAPGATKAVRILGEDLVLFRDTVGRTGLIQQHCPHRGTSLLHGCVDEEGIRCPYHGWKFDAEGQCLDTPAELGESTFVGRKLAQTYPTTELGGLVFAYLGNLPAPRLPRFDLFVREGVIRDVGIAVVPCNWLQIMENSVDPLHVEHLHGHHLGHTRARLGEPAPVHYRKKHLRIGFDLFEYGILKRRIVEGGSEEDDDWKVGHPLVFPNMLRVGSAWQHRFQIRVPVDDTNTLHFWYSCYEPPPGRDIPAQDEVPAYEIPWKDRDGGFRIDFVDGQDIMAWVSQGPIADRTCEMLGSSDAGIALYRKLLSNELERVERGEDPMGIARGSGEGPVIELPQERNKFRAGDAFLAEALELSHVRFSPLKELLAEMYRTDASARDDSAGTDGSA